MEYVLSVELNKSLCKAKVIKNYPYHQNEDKQYVDKITYAGSQIIVEGSRSKTISPNFLKTSNSTQFSALISALVYAYFRFGDFKIKAFKIELDGNMASDTPKIDTTRFSSKNVFGKLYDADLAGLFESRSRSKVFQSALTNFTLASSSSERRFEHLWRGFNSLARYYTGIKKDSDMLAAIRKDMDAHPEAYKLSISWAKRITKNDLDKRLRVNSMIANAFPKGTKEKKKNNLKRWYTDYTDARVLLLMKEKIPCKQADLSKLGILQTTKNQINRKLALGKTYDIDVVRITVLKYAYYLRNKLFHAERIPTYFLFNTANEEGVSFINDPLIAICTDLMGSISSGNN